MTSRCGLSLHAEKAIIGRLLILEILVQYNPVLHADGYKLLAKKLYNNLTEITDDELDHPKEEQSLEDFLRSLSRGIRKGLPYPDKESKVICREIFKAVDQTVAEFCAEPTDPLTELFERVLKATVYFYDRCGISISQQLQDSISFAADFKTEPPRHRLPVSYHVDGTTTFGVEESKPASTVELVLWPSFLDWSTNLAMPYVLFHECVSHVFQGPWTEERREPKGWSNFADGWMDLVAYQLHTAVMRGLGQEAGVPDFPYSSDHVHIAQNFHQARGMEQEGDRTWGHRAVGIQSAGLLLKFFRALPEIGDDPETELWRLSLALNTSSIDHKKREKFTSLLHERLRRASSVGTVSPLLRQYLEDHDIHRLVESVLGLRESFAKRTTKG